MGPALADRHCSFARQSAFYAKEFSSEAGAGSAAICRTKTAEAFERLKDAMAELEICSCAVAEEALRRWLKDHRPTRAGDARSCSANANAIKNISEIVLKRVETCF